jgi:hypothetical protein
MNETIYRRSDGGFVTGSGIWSRFEGGAWRPCCWNTETGAEWVVTDDDELLRLTPLDDGRAGLPPRTRLERRQGGFAVVAD